MSAPSCSIQYPSCGACGLETRHDGDSFYCEECDLDYGDGADGNEGTFRDEEQPPCAEPCDNKWHSEANLNLTCQPCQLPKGHTSMHWTDCK